MRRRPAFIGLIELLVIAVLVVALYLATSGSFDRMWDVVGDAAVLVWQKLVAWWRELWTWMSTLR